MDPYQEEQQQQQRLQKHRHQRQLVIETNGGVGYGSGPQERVHQVPRTATQTDKYPFEGYQGQIPDCCAAAAAVQDPYPRPPSGYDGRCYDEYHRTTPYQDDSYSQDVPPTFHRPQSRLGYEECPQSRVGYTSDSRCASGLGYDDTGGGYLDQTDPRMYCTGGYCMGDTMMATSRGVCGEEVELDMRRHIQACACTCNHMGYGNYMDYQCHITSQRCFKINLLRKMQRLNRLILTMLFRQPRDGHYVRSTGYRFVKSNPSIIYV
ncbi:hypothetical protein HZH68_013263 [Vespula germanica]|uniref:Uncharacterized protein n=1 Tax=Vespula germanica TaxID=30212 RepID=A0A834JIK2_VESGE|nr:hypothetical protein HZH68_013263 [Vespula germanica]